MSVSKKNQASSRTFLKQVIYSRTTRLTIFMTFLGFILVFSNPSGIINYEGNSMTAPLKIESAPILAGNLYTTYTADYVSNIAPGTVMGQGGFAYVSNEDDALILVNPLSEQIIGIPLPSLGTTLQATLHGFDFDHDGETEFIVGHDNTTHILVLVIDFNDGSIDAFPLSILSLDELVVGDFNGDGSYDFAAIDKGLSRMIEFFDPDTSAQIGIYSAGRDIHYVDVGRSASLTQDSLVVVMDNNLTIVQGDGTPIVSTLRSSKIYGVKTFNHSSTVFDDIMISEASGIVTALRADTLTQIFARGLVPGTTQSLTFDVGNFSADSQIDIVAVSKQHDILWLLNGTNGADICLNYDQLSGDYRYDVGRIDSDDVDDVVIRKAAGNPTFIHGAGCTTGFVVNEASNVQNMYAFDLNGDGRDDILGCADYQVYSVISDTQSPELTVEPISPAHPTALDDYIVIEVGVFEESSIERAKVFIRGVGETEYSTQITMMPNTPRVKYYAFITGLEAGFYEYYIHFVDSYRNEAFNGTADTPNDFEVIGNTAWEVIKSDVYLGTSVHIFEKGNTSTGEDVLYMANWNTTGNQVQVDVHAITGEVLDSISVPVGPSNVMDYGIYTAMMDGDEVQDIVLILSNTTGTTSYVFHGTNTSLYYSSTQPVTISRLDYVSLVDDDGDQRDELHILDNGNWRLVRMDHDGAWFENSLAPSAPADAVAIAQTAYDDTWQICTVTNRTRLDFYDAANLTSLRSASLYFDPSFTEVDLLTAFEYNNATHNRQQFGVQYTLWNVSGPTSRFYFFDIFTEDFNATSIDHSDVHIRNIVPYDYDSNGVDDMFIITMDGELIALSIDSEVTIHWMMPFGKSSLTGYVFSDFDGNGREDLVLFTHQDKKLKCIDTRGFITREIALAEIVINPVNIGSVDPGLGEEIAAYPIIKDWSEYKIGAYRDLDWFYRMNITSYLDSTEILQGSSIIANVSVHNIFGESLSDASVTLTVSYSTGTMVARQTSALLYSVSEELYIYDEIPTYPIGAVNLSLDIAHADYQPIFDLSVGEVTIRSPLIVNVHQESVGSQGEDKIISITVTDSLSHILSDANVDVTIGTNQYAASFADPDYELLIPSITWIPGDYIVNVTANHSYAIAPKSVLNNFRLLTNSLSISNNIPISNEQDQLLQGWLNITDLYANSIENAQVRIQSGAYEFSLIQIEPGRYFLDDIASLPIGNYTFTIKVSSIYISGTEFGNFSLVVTGDLLPSIEYPTEVDAGTNFTVSIFIFDAYGTTPEGSLAMVEFDGENYTATHVSGPEYSVQINASVTVGSHPLFIFINSTYGNDWDDVFIFYVNSQATLSLLSNPGWDIVQGSVITLRINITDWSQTFISDATVTLLSPISRGFTGHSNGTYTLDLSTIGFSPGNYSILISVSHEYLVSGQISHQMSILGVVTVQVDYEEPILNHQHTTFNFVVIDQYGNPINYFNYSVSFGSKSNSSTSSSHEFWWEVLPDFAPNNYWLNITISGEYLISSSQNYSLPVKGVVSLNIITPSESQSVMQGEDINFTLFVKDLILTEIVDADVWVQIKGNTYGLNHMGSGIYSALISTIGFSLDSYNATITVSHPLMNADIIYRLFILNGTGVVSVVTTPSTPVNHEDLTFNITITDQYGNPVNEANYSLSFNGQSTSGTTSSYKFSWTITPSTTPGLYSLNVSLEGGYLIAKNYTFGITLTGTISSYIHSPSIAEIHNQGSSVNFTVSVQDLIGTDITGAQVTVIVLGTSHSMTMVVAGVYAADVSTLGYPLGTYNASISISHPYMNLETKYIVFLLKGEAIVSLEYSPTKLYNHVNSTFNFTIRDTYGNPVNLYNYSVIFGALYSTSGSSYSYILTWETETEFIPSLQWLNITLSSTYLYTTSYNYTLAVFGSPLVSVDKPLEMSSHIQGEAINFTVIIEDLIGTDIVYAQVRVLLAGVTYSLFEIHPGIYSANITTVGLRLNQYAANITITHGYLDTGYASVTFNLVGTPHLTVSMNPSPVSNKENVTFSMDLTDVYGNPINDFNYSLIMEGYSYSAIASWYQFSWEVNPSWIPGEYYLIVDINSTYAIGTRFNITVPVQGVSSASILDPLPGSSCNQGALINFTVHVTDELFNNITGADVTVVLYGSSFLLNMTSPGIYTGNVSTVGLPLGSYTASITVSQAFLDTQYLSVMLSLIGSAEITYTIDTDRILNNEDTTFTFYVRDQYGNPLSPYNYSLNLGFIFIGSDTSSTYTFEWMILPDLVPGEYTLNISIVSSFVLQTNYSWVLNIFGEQQALFQSPISLESIIQGDILLLSVSLQDLNSNPISDASIVVTIGSTSYSLTEVSSGIYSRTITTTHLALGEYTARAVIQHDYLVSTPLEQSFFLIGNGKPSVIYEQPIYVGNSTLFTIGIFDTFSYSVQNYNWSVTFQGSVYTGATAIDDNSFNLTLSIDGPPGVYAMLIDIENPFLASTSFVQNIVVRSEATCTIHEPTSSVAYLQANDSIPFVISVTDSQGSFIPNAQVRVQVHESIYDLDSCGNGTYHTTVATVGWRYNEYNYFVFISHQFMELVQMNGSVTVIADPVITIRTSAEEAVQMTEFIIDIEVKDLYGTPLTGLYVSVDFAYQTRVAYEIEDGKYRAVFDNITASHATYQIAVSASGEMCIEKLAEPVPMYVNVQVPDLDAMFEENIEFMIPLGIIIFLVSVLGMGLYFRVASGISTGIRSSEDAERGTRRLDRTYGITLVIALMIFVHSLIVSASGDYSLAVIESILLIGFSVLLYGLWLYRDSYSAILQTGSLSKKRMVAGIWHLALIPVMIVQIVMNGSSIETFQALILEENVFNLAGFDLPMIILTIFGTYLSSIVVVVINHYKETSKGLQRITHMQTESTPTKVVHEERTLLVEKTSSSIRTKFLMFLLLVGATAVSSLSFIRSANLAILILLPVVFLVVIPFISSKLLKAIGRLRGHTRNTGTFTP